MDDNLLADFIAECREHLEGIETDLLAIEEAGESADKELVNKVFRAAHSIKGGSGFFQLDKIKQLAHSIETVLDMMRSGKIKSQPDVVNILLMGFDLLREMVNNTASLEQYDISQNVTALQELVDLHQNENEKGSQHRNVTFNPDTETKSVSIPEIDYQAAQKDNQYIYQIEYDLIHDIDQAGISPLILLKSLSGMGIVVDVLFDLNDVGTLDDPPVNCIPLTLIYRTVIDPAIMNELDEIYSKKIKVLFNPGKKSDTDINIQKEKQETITAGTEKTDEIKPEIPEEKIVIGEKKTTKNSTKADEDIKVMNKATAPAAADTLRINVQALDTLMAHAGELVLSRNQLVDAISRKDNRAINTSAQHLSYVISELQEAVMQTRLQPVGNVFNKFHRIVRDMSISLKKNLRLVVEGKDVELDKTIIEGLSDPLTHMVRNAADHGVESPQERIQSGKNPEGTITLKAYHGAGHVIIEIGDDGKGINPEKIASKALNMGLVTSEKLKGMTDYDKMALIFYPGLSTADKITETSGRGVGMDVVKTNLDRLGGKVSISSEPGKGTLFTIKLPLTLAIIPSLIVSEEKERFAIPQVNVVELLRIPSAQVKERIQVVGDAEVVVLRGELIPLLRFADILGIVNTYIDPVTGKREIDRRNRIADRRSHRKTITGDNVEGAVDEKTVQSRNTNDRRYRADSDLNIVIIASGLLQYGLVVGHLHNSEEIVVKPLGRHLKGLQEYAGATIMGDGDVALIIDATGLALKANISSVSAAADAANRDDKKKENVLTEASQSFLEFNNRENELCALPLALVQRVESITKEQIETFAGKKTMQYRGSQLPLLELSDAADVEPISLDKELAVIVMSVAGHSVGLLGLMPVSVLESNANIDTVTHRQKGISGSMIVNNETVLIVNIHEVIESLHPEWNIMKKTAANESKAFVLVAEDSDFFRSQIERYINEAGYEVFAASDGMEAWQFLESQKNSVDIIVTDIEMPNMNGLDLCRKIRADDRFRSIPVIALTSLAGEENEIQGKDAGVTEYQVKLDKDRLVESIEKLINKK